MPSTSTAAKLINVTISCTVLQGLQSTTVHKCKRGNDSEKTETVKRKKEIEGHGCWVIVTCLAEVVSASMAERVLCHSTCRRGRCWDLLNWLDRDFCRCLMELTLSYLCAISVRALYAKRQSTSVDPAFAEKVPPQPFQCVLEHCWVIDKNVVGQGQCDNWETLPQTLNRLSGVKQQARATEY